MPTHGFREHGFDDAQLTGFRGAGRLAAKTARSFLRFERRTPVQTVLSAVPHRPRPTFRLPNAHRCCPASLYGRGAVRGRLSVNEWYGEVERLNAIGEVGAAVDLLLDMVTGTRRISSPTAHMSPLDLMRNWR